MKIISWNVAYRVRKQQLQLDALVSREPDIIGLHEVTSRTLPLWAEGLQKAGYTHTISSFRGIMRVRSRNITKVILFLQLDQAITDIIFRSNLLHHFQRKYYTKALF